MALSKEAQAYLNESLKESTPSTTPPKEKEIISKSINEKREELEILKLDNEISRLSKPDIPETNYFKEMLAQQQAHFNQLLEMAKQQNDLKVEIEKLKLGYGEDNSGLQYLEMFMPLLPELLKNKSVAAPQTQEIAPVNTITQPKKEEVKKIEVNTPEDLEKYKAGIKDGTITEEMAYKDFLENKNVPKYLKKMPKKAFTAEFLKIKNN